MAQRRLAKGAQNSTNSSRTCELCQRKLPDDTNANTVWCRMCTSRHTIGTPCANCQGQYHFPLPPGVTAWNDTTLGLNA